MKHLTFLKMFFQASSTPERVEITHSGPGYCYSTTKHNSVEFVDTEDHFEFTDSDAEDVLSHIFCVLWTELKLSALSDSGTVTLDRLVTEEWYRVSMRVSTLYNHLANKNEPVVFLYYGWLVGGCFYSKSTFELRIGSEANLDDFLETHLEEFERICSNVL